MATATIPISGPQNARVHPAPASENPRISTNGLRVARADHLIDIPDFSVKPGQTVALVGPSGSGKTTALMAMSLMHRPASGTILIEGNDPWTLGLQRENTLHQNRDTAPTRGE